MDEEYVANIEEKLAIQLKDEYQLEIITESAYLEQYQKQSHRIDLLIIDEKLKAQFCSNQTPEIVISLTETDNDSRIYINKYDGVNAIVQKIGPQYFRECGKKEKTQTKTIEVISICGGSGKTIAALGIAMQLENSGKKVLYLNAEMEQNFCESMSLEKIHYAEEMLALYLADGSDNVMENILKDIQHERFDYVPPFRRMLMAYRLRAEHYYKVAEKIASRNIYDYIVVEHPRELTEAGMRRISKGDFLLITVLQNGNAIARIKKLIDNVGSIYGQGMIVCGKYRIDEPNELVDREFLSEWPICEYISERNEKIDMEKIYKYKLFKSTMEAIR